MMIRISPRGMNFLYYFVGGRDLDTLKLEECKAYLRKYGLRLTGTKSICIQRIQEHWRIKDGNAENLYPRSSFVINCTGDVCTGDIVLFTQRVYEKFDIVTRGGNIIGKRTVAGRVVKESYGAAKQQHTFTVEIFWSKGIKALPPLFPLLVKGRNLYRLKTFRQRWDNEAERSKILAEKHKRGAAARRVREIKKARSTNGGSKHQGQSCRIEAPTKRRDRKSDTSTKRERNPPRTQPSKAVKSSSSKRQRRSQLTKTPKKRQRNQEPNPATETHIPNITRNKATSLEETMIKHIPKPGALEPSAWNSHHVAPYGHKVPPLHPILDNGPLHSDYQRRMQYNHRYIMPAFNANGGTYPFSYYELGSTSTVMGVTRNQMVEPTLHHQTFSSIDHFRHPYTNSNSWFDPRGVGHLRTQANFDPQFVAIPSRIEMHERKNGSQPCSTPGCQDMGAKSCIGSFCSKCCRRTGRKCQRHKV
ncbi:SAP domain-containing protein isoform X2 [Tasmannia lanceolata]|uniref:SAP domain-containing protein isoform X2 n=1 Tax=Tasmannia lanceolata TaxID=3420 RepID=UPI0040649D10